MKRLKKYVLLLLALFFILLGAALPYLVSSVQDAQTDAFQKKLDLHAVDITLRQKTDIAVDWKTDVESVLQLVSMRHTESRWTGETVLDEADACRAALAVMEELDCYGVISENEFECLAYADGMADPQLLVGEDGTSALVWACTWDCDPGIFVTVDDATGMGVRMLVNNGKEDGRLVENVYFQVDQWNVFLQDYYDLKLADTEEKLYETNGGWTALFDMRFSAKKGELFYDLNLKITDSYVFFNYQ